jgi:hypothetical protein
MSFFTCENPRVINLFLPHLQSQWLRYITWLSLPSTDVPQSKLLDQLFHFFYPAKIYNVKKREVVKPMKNLERACDKNSIFWSWPKKTAMDVFRKEGEMMRSTRCPYNSVFILFPVPRWSSNIASSEIQSTSLAFYHRPSIFFYCG